MTTPGPLHAALACAAAAFLSVPAGAKGISWPEDQALPVFPAVSRLDVADIERNTDEEKLVFTTLQGIVNRSEPRIYLLVPADEGKDTWLKDGLGHRFTLHDDPWKLLDKYRREVRGMVVYDPEVPDTINVATTLAGLENAVVASPAMAGRLSAAPYELPIVQDLRGRFKTRLEAYLWQYQQLWPRVNRRMLSALPPTHSVTVQPDRMPEFTTVLREDRPIEDASNRGVRTVDLTPFLGKGPVYLRVSDARPQDGWGAAVHEVVIRADGREIARFVPGGEDERPFLYDVGGSQMNAGSGGHRYADNGRFFVYRGTPPPGTKKLEVDLEIWNQFEVAATTDEPVRTVREEPNASQRDYPVANRAMTFWLDPNIAAERRLLQRILADVKTYTPYIGWFAQDVAGEFGGTELVSRYGVYVLAADWSTNLSVLSARTKLPRPPRAPASPKLKNKLYVSFLMSEGDNLQYNQHRMRVLWDDPARGQTPITWTSTPLLVDVMPGVLSYFWKSATPNDQLIAGPSGAGYIYATPWPDSTFDVFARQTAKYNKQARMDTVYVLNRIDGRDIPLDPVKARLYAEVVKPTGLFLGWGDSSEVKRGPEGMPIVTVQGTGSAQGVRQAIRAALARTDGSGPEFLAIGVLAWTTTPTDLARITRELESENVSVVRGDHFFGLLRASWGSGS